MSVHLSVNVNRVQEYAQSTRFTELLRRKVMTPEPQHIYANMRGCDDYICP